MVSKKKTNLLELLFSFFLLLCIADVMPAQVSVLPSETVDSGLGGGNAIVGTVLIPSGNRLTTQIKIRLVTMTRGDRTTMTDDYGSFSFRSLPPGNYTIIIDKEKAYEPLMQTLSIIQPRGWTPQVYNLNLRLKLKGNTESKPGVINSDFANVPKRALDFFTKALELSKKGDYKDAIEQLKFSISEYPDFMLAFNELGVQYLRLNDLEKADESFQAALKIKPEAFAPLMNHGIVLVHRKKFEEAQSVLCNALRIKERSAVAHYFLGQALANLGRFDEAEKEFASAIALGGDEMKEAHRFLAIIYGARKDKKRASEELEIYLRLVPTAPDAEQLRQVIKQFKGLDELIPSTPSKTKPSS